MKQILYHESLLVLPNGMRKGIQWFNKLRGKEIRWPNPSPIAGFPFLVSSAKAIYKPDSELNPADVAFSIRQNLKSTYKDKEPFYRSDGSWVYQYHQEGDSPDLYVNRALCRNIVARSPVVVLIQTKSKPISMYKVLGIGMVVALDKDFFFIEGFSSDGLANLEFSRTLEFVEQCQLEEKSLIKHKANQLSEKEAVVSSKLGRDSNLIEVTRNFKNQLLKEYSYKCAISESATVEALEVFDFSADGDQKDIRSSNTFIVRADLCNLLCSWCMSIDPKSRRVVIADQLIGTEYEVFKGAELKEPIGRSRRLSESTLRSHYLIFKRIQAGKRESNQLVNVRKGSNGIDFSSEYIRISLLTKVEGVEKVADRSGLNWGQRPKRNPNQAYLPVPSDIQKIGFFPAKGVAFSIECDDGAKFKCVIAQASGKAIETPDDNALLGKYFRERLGVDSGEPVALRHLLDYGRTAVEISKIGKLKYYLDFSRTQHPLPFSV